MAVVWTSECRTFHAMTLRLLIALLWIMPYGLVSATEQTFTLVTWNIEHLAAVEGSGCRGRDAADYQAIKRYLEQLEPDLIAFQEVENRRAAERVFPETEYEIHISNRPARQFSQCYDSSNHRLMQRTGFAVRKDIGARLGLKAVRQPDFRQLQGAYTSGRWGVYLILEQTGGGRAGAAPVGFPLHLLSIHLKAGCTYQSVRGNKVGRNCRLLNEQVDALAGWVGARTDAGQDFIIAGDFNRQLDQLSDGVWLQLESGAGNGGAYVDLEKALHGIKHPRPYKRKYPFAIDHIIYNQALDTLLLEEKTYFDVCAEPHSDHLPLISVFKLR